MTSRDCLMRMGPGPTSTASTSKPTWIAHDPDVRASSRPRWPLGAIGSRPFHRSLRYQLVLGDGLAASVAWVFAAVVAGDKGGTRQLVCALAAVVATMTALRRAGLYRTHVCNLPSRQVVRVVASATLGAVAYLLCGWLAGSVVGATAVAGLGMSAALILTVRWRFGRWLKARRSVGQHLRRSLLIGTNEDAIALWNMLSEEPELGYRVVGVVGSTAGRCAVGTASKVRRQRGTFHIWPGEPGQTESS